MENQEPNADRSQDDPHPEVGPSVYQSRHSSGSDPEEAPHNVHWTNELLNFSELLFC